MKVPVLLNLHLPKFGPAQVRKGVLFLRQPGLLATDDLFSGSSGPQASFSGEAGLT